MMSFSRNLINKTFLKGKAKIIPTRYQHITENNMQYLKLCIYGKYQILKRSFFP